MKKLIILVPVFLLLVSFVYANSVSMEINPIRPAVISSTDLEAEFDYKFERDNDNWDLVMCHKDFEKNKNKVKALKFDNKGVKSNIDLSKAKCNKIKINGNKGQKIKIGDKTTIIEFLEDNITLTVSPENEICNYLTCTANIILKNSGNQTITFNSSDLDIEILTNNYEITSKIPAEEQVLIYNYSGEDLINTYYETQNITRTRNNDEAFIVNIPPTKEYIFNIKAIMPQPNTQFKYNTTIIYLETEYKIDPYFNTTNTNFNNGNYINTTLNPSGFVELNSTYTSGTYESEIFDSSNYSTSWNNITWFIEQNYQASIPDNQATDIGDYVYPINMTSNRILFHLDNNEDDDSGNSFDGIINNNVTYSTTDKIDGSHSAHFDGTSSNIETSHLEELNGKDLTFTAWVKTLEHNPSNHHITIARHLSTTTKNFQLGMSDNNKFYWAGYTACNSGSVDTETTETMELDTWYFVAWKLDSGNYRKIYVNGINLTETTSVNTIPSGCPTNTSIGSNLRTTSTNWNGFVDDVVIWNRSLSDFEIAGLYRRYIADNPNIYVRSCNASDCSDANWTNIADTSTQQLSLPDARYFQYKFDFSSQEANISAQLYNVSINYNLPPPANNPPTADENISDQIVNLALTSCLNIQWNVSDYDALTYDINTTIMNISASGLLSGCWDNSSIGNYSVNINATDTIIAPKGGG